MKKFIAKLVNWRTRENLSVSHSQAPQREKEEARMAQERHEMIMENRDRKYVSEATVPAGEVRRPDDSAVEKGNE